MTEIELIHKKIRERMNELADYLANNSCDEIGDYKYICGMIKGLGSVENDIIEINNRNNQE